MLPLPPVIRDMLNQPATVDGARWACGVITVPSRRETLLPGTLEALTRGGFDRPRLFVDGCDASQYRWLGMPVTARIPQAGAPMNTLMALAELLASRADIIALFQDDLSCCANIRQYIERCGIQPHGYLNLYTFPENEGERGWHRTKRSGLGGVGLVFTAQAVRTLLNSKRLAALLEWKWRRQRCIDGTIGNAMRASGFLEYVHSPSLVQHTGLVSAMGNKRHPQSQSYPGDSFDAMTLAEAAWLPKA